MLRMHFGEWSLGMSRNKNMMTGAALCALMAATRMHGSILPDASLAVYMIAGFFIASPLFFGVLTAEAALLDYMAVAHMGVPDYCITPAYWFLIPTYAVLWGAGRYCSKLHQKSLDAAVSLAALSAAFLISNGAFYLFSGRYADMGAAEYASRIAQYYLPYVGSAVFYLIPAALIYVALKNQHKHA
jgi:hypothetical protein